MKFLKMKTALFALLILVDLAGCQTPTTYQSKHGTAIDVMNQQMQADIQSNRKVDATASPRVPTNVSSAMMPGTSLSRAYGGYSRRFDISVKDVPAKTFFMGLVQGTRYSIAVSPEVSENITLNLKQVTVEDVLKTVEDVYGYTYRRTSYGYEILPSHLETRIFAVNYLDITRKGKSLTQVSSGEITQGSTTSSSSLGITGAQSTSTAATVNTGSVDTSTDLNFWKQLKTTLESMLKKDEEHQIVVNPQAGIVVVKAYPNELRQIEYYLNTVQNNMNRQVILEAKILEVILNDENQMGINWQIFGAQLNSINALNDAGIDGDIFPDDFNIQIDWSPGDFETTIQALETQGNIQTLSSPRVATMNNQKAVIKVGTDQFFVTDLSTTNTQTTATTSTPTQDIELTPFFSGITLDVTPQIDQAGNVTLHVHPAVSLVQTQQKDINLGTQGGIITLPLAESTIRESDTVVHARNGQVVVIGGLMANQSEELLAQLPFFGNIPFLGTLFRNTKQTSRKSELVILIRPTVVSRGVWTRQMEKDRQRMMALKKGFHFSDRPDLFGTEAERWIKPGPKTVIPPPNP